ncbi:MAG TPA: HAD family hydrolase [Oligoflexia bacterium]|nr:HAD family hydrolase [Oligoflexia bacterium]HMP27243.1 HAD family hydrolase [Oligoflexia bacterium]
MSNQLDRDKALALVYEYTISESLRKHMLAVEKSMLWYARYFNLSPDEQLKWGIVGLLHDFDYESHPDPLPPDGHPFWGCALLKKLGYEEEIITAILGHASYTGTPRNSLMAKALFAVDELSGFLVACSLVRPDRSIMNLKAESVVKKMKDKAFAKGCSREEMKSGAAELGIELNAHIENLITALSDFQ